jgi:hypothetical protein
VSHTAHRASELVAPQPLAADGDVGGATLQCVEHAATLGGRSH